MKIKTILILCICLLLAQGLFAQEEDSKLSQRFASEDSTILQPKKIETYHKVFATLKGLTFVETGKTIGRIKEEFKAVNANDEIKNKEDRRFAKRKALHTTFVKNPGSLLSIFWPLFLIFFVFWFLKQYKKVFIQKIQF